jgi:hypothetical protein
MVASEFFPFNEKKKYSLTDTFLKIGLSVINIQDNNTFCMKKLIEYIFMNRFETNNNYL